MIISKEQMRLYAVTDRSWLKEGESLARVVEELILAGLTCVQLREKDADDDTVRALAMELKTICNRYHVPLIINDRPDLAREIGADGVHVGLSDMGIEKAREYLGDGFIIGGSAHNVSEALAAQRAGADYIGCGAVFGSKTKHNVTTLALEELQRITQAVTIPVVAIGGINLTNVHQLCKSGIDGIAVISALFAADDKVGAVRDFLAVDL